MHLHIKISIYIVTQSIETVRDIYLLGGSPRRLEWQVTGYSLDLCEDLWVQLIQFIDIKYNILKRYKTDKLLKNSKTGLPKNKKII